MSFIPETIIRALCWTLLHSLWQGLALAVVAGVVMVLTKRRSSTTRYAVLSLLVVAFLAVSGYTFFHELRVPAAPAVVDALGKVQNGIQDMQPSAVHAVATDSPQRPDLVRQLVQYFNTHAAMVVVLWFIVFMARFIKLLSGLVYVQRVRHYGISPVGADWEERLRKLLARLAITRPVRLLESALIKVPVVVGWLKPVILVPVGMLAQLPADQVESILLHELAHISRRDYLANFLQHLIDTLYFFNPALIWVSSLIRTERENCCDDVAIRESRSRRKLIEALVSFHAYQQGSGAVALGFAGKENGVVRRVERIVHKTNHSLNVGERALLMGGVVLLCGAFVTVNRTSGAARTATIKHTVHTVETTSSRMARNAGFDQAATGSAVMTGPGNATVVGKATRSASASSGRAESPVTIATSFNIRAQVKVGPQAPAPTQTVQRADTTPPEGTMTKADVDMIIKAHEHGVTTEFIDELKHAGYTVTMEQAIRMRDHGVSVDFLLGLQKEGFGHVPLEAAVRLVDHGVSIPFIQRIRALGFPDLTLDQAVTLIDHGVSADFIEQWKKKTGTKLELGDYIKLQDAGVRPD